MQYLELTFHINPYNEAAADVLAALLADAGCDTFEPSDTGLTAYILQDAYDEAAIRAAIASTLATFPVTVPEDSPIPPVTVPEDSSIPPITVPEGSPEGLAITFTAAPAPDENWNATWETEHHFEPIALPEGQLLHIIPRQAFGSGEHATTRLMLGLLSDLAPLAGATVIDAGCGTGILGIAALKLGAAHVFAYDIDEWSVRNAQDNYALNGCEAEIVLGDASCLAAAPQADILLANINRNILLADLPAFAAHLKPGGHLLLSGFMEPDIAPLLAAATPLGLTLCDTLADGDWRALHFKNEE